MIVSATGTGKTYLAAFDVQQFHPKRVFIVHSELILMKALESFKLILGGKDDDYGVLSGILRILMQNIYLEQFKQYLKVNIKSV